jgi:hypothetical protein
MIMLHMLGTSCGVPRIPPSEFLASAHFEVLHATVHNGDLSRRQRGFMANEQRLTALCHVSMRVLRAGPFIRNVSRTICGKIVQSA